MSEMLIEIKNAIVAGQNAIVMEKVEAALKQGLNPVDILNSGMVDAMAEVGQSFERGESFVPEMLLAARAMQSGLAILRPVPGESRFQSDREGGHRHGQGRPARHRQEPGQHDAGRGRLRNPRPGNGRRPRKDSSPSSRKALPTSWPFPPC